jgi:alkaline phosphatase
LTLRIARPYIANVKWRNQLLALFCLIVFAALGVLYFQHWVVQKPFGIVLFIAEGLTASRLAPTRLYAGGADTRLAIDSLSYSASLTNHSNDFASADTAAAASALSTGVKVNNRAIAIDADGKKLANILDLARASGRTTGFVTDGCLTTATAAAFYTHASSPDEKELFATNLARDGKIDLVLGGGAQDFLPTQKGGRRRDNADLLLEIKRNGADLVRTKAELEAVPGWRRPKVFGVFAQSELAYADEMEARSEQPSLADMVRRAIELLQFNRTGYLLIVDARLMGKAAEENAGERTLSATMELDRAVAVAENYVGTKSMIIVCGDVGVGGLAMNGHPFRKDGGLAVLGVNSAGEPWLTWATGPNGTRSYGAAKVVAAADGRTEPEASPNASPATEEPAAFFAPSALHTVEDVVAFGSGPGAEALHGTLDNTAIFELLRKNL